MTKEEKIERFVAIVSKKDYGDGFGYGFGFGYGSGYGDGCFGDDDGCFGDGHGFGYASGDGCFGDGHGFGYASGDGRFGDGVLTISDTPTIKSYNGFKVYSIDNIATIVFSVHLKLAKGAIINNDLTLTPCFIAKKGEFFAHGTTAKGAIAGVQSKWLDEQDEEDKIALFVEHFKEGKAYKGKDFYKWHNILTGSCQMGRDNFVKNHNIDLDDFFTVKEFISITENGYGKDIIKKLKKYYK